AVVVPGGVLEVAKALAQILTAEFRTRSRLSRSRVVDARRGSDRTTNQAARRALNQIIDRINIRGPRFVIQAVVAPRPRCIEQPRRRECAVVAYDQVAGAELQLVIEGQAVSSQTEVR